MVPLGHPEPFLPDFTTISAPDTDPYPRDTDPYN
jgi:hypothetical protein